MKTGDTQESWRPGASRAAIEARAGLLADIRAFFAGRNVLEVETPVLSALGNSDPNIESMTISGRQRYLRTSPEFAMKRLLAAGLSDIYELGRVFRAGEAGRHHNPEFTLLEWYRGGMTYLELAGEVVDLMRACGRGAFDGWAVERLSYRDLFRRHTGLDAHFCSETELEDCAAERGIMAPDGLEHGEWLDLVMAQVIQPALPGECFTIVFDYPPEQAALSRIRLDDPPVAERFEVYLGRQELANGYQELTDPAEQRERFENENRKRRTRGQDSIAIDTGLVRALEAGLPECSGVALGVDRLLMSLLRIDDIDAVLAFGKNRI